MRGEAIGLVNLIYHKQLMMHLWRPRSPQFNAENILFIESAPLADAYSVYIDHLVKKYH